MLRLDRDPYSHSILLVKIGILRPESEELSHQPSEHLLPSLCVSGPKVFNSDFPASA